MNTPETFDAYKYPTEDFPIGVNWATRLEAGDNVVGHTVTAKDPNGNDASATILHDPMLGANVSTAGIKNGAQGAKYCVKFEAATAFGRTRVVIWNVHVL
jgi:hypothetical protein